ncbi:MAG: STAS domain-containing protein [Pseudoxanthomonas sp.]
MASAKQATVTRQGDALAFEGALDRAAAIALWVQANRALDGVRRFDLTAVASVDSAGLALLAELAERLRARGTPPVLAGEPAGLAELRDAYRLGAELEFPGAGATRT